MANAGSVTIKIKGDDSAYKRTLTGISNATKTAVKGMTAAIGTLSAAWSAVGLVSVKYNAEMEQLQTSFKVMTGSADKAANVMERLRKLGAKTPFASKDLAQATQLLMQYGFGADAAIDSIEMLGDISQGSAEKLTRIATAYGQMTSAGKVHLEDVKQMIEAGFNPLLEISEKTGESMDSLYDRISKGTLAVSEITAAMQSATSEGGRFFGSMAAQSETVQGLLSTLKDELQTLGGDVFEPISDSLREKVLPEAIRVVQEMQDAYGRGGMDGLVDSLTNEIPRLVDAASAALEKVAVKLKAKLPGILKKLISTLPSLLASAGDSILPTLVDTVFDIIAVAVEEIVGRLPELLPVILRGFGNLLKSVATGLWDVTEGLFSGIETALKKWGLLGMSPLEAFEEAWEKADTSLIEDVDIDLGVNITVEEYQSKIDAALEKVRTALKNVPGLTDDQKTAIETAIINGTGIDLINQTLTNMGVSQTKADEITAAITSAKTTIENTLINDLGLDPAAVENITALAAEGGNVQKALEEDYGVDTKKAVLAAKTITTSMESIETAAQGVGLSETTINDLQTSAGSDKAAVEGALLLMGIDHTVIDPVLASYDTVTGSLTARAKSVFDQITEEFTNGIPESDADVQEAKDAVKGLFKAAYQKVDEWKAEALADLERSGLTGDALESAIADVNAQANGMVEELNQLEQESMAWTEENANKSTAFVQGNLDQLDGIVSRLTDINARIDILTSEQFNTAKARRNLVKAGAVSDVTGQFEAFKVTALELEKTIEEAENAAGEALDKAVEDFKDDAEGYAAREKEILDELASEKEAAYARYNAETASIIAGIVKASPDLSEAFESFASEQETKDMALKLKDEIANAVNQAAMTGEGVSLDAFIEGLTADGIDLSTLASTLNMDVGQLTDMIATALKSSSEDTLLNAAIVDYVDRVESNLSAAMQNAGIDATAIPAIKKAIEEGYLKAAGDVDFTSTETILSTMFDSTVTDAASGISEAESEITSATETTVNDAIAAVDVTDDAEDIGNQLANGTIAGIKEKAQAVALAARQMVRAAITGMRKEAEIASPSKATKRLGAFFGQGFALGIENEAQHAAESARRMAESAIGAIDSIGGRLTVSQQVNAGGMASAFQTMLAGLNLATDNGQPVQLFINGRLVAETIKRDIAQTQAGYNMDLARGVGKA